MREIRFESVHVKATRRRYRGHFRELNRVLLLQL